MAKHLQLGRDGETKALTFLKALGYRFMASNWRYKRLEIDLVFKDKEVLVFVEVKARRSAAYGEPQEFVDIAKQRRLIRAASAYISAFRHQGEIRFDIVAVYMGQSEQIVHIKDAFWNS